jgi:hypothetical protein
MKKFKYKVFDIDTLEHPEDEFLNMMGSKRNHMILNVNSSYTDL